MGIHNLNKVIKTYAEDVIEMVKDSDMKGKVLAVDTSIVLYQFLIAIKKDTDDFKTEDGKITTHIHAILMKTFSLLKRGIKPIFVFDGAPPSIKEGTLKSRDDVKDKARKRLKDEINEDEVRKLQKRSISISNEQISECKALLEVMGVPYVEAPEEADSQCVYLVNNGFADGVASEDMDILTFGARVLYRNVNSTGKITKYDLSKLLKELNLNMNQFIDMCILLGCDYCPTISGIGMKRAYDLITQHQSIEGILELDKYSPTKEFKKTYKAAREYFKHAPVKAVTSDDLQWRELDEDGFKDLLQKYEYSDNNIKKHVSMLKGGSKSEFLMKKCSIYDQDDMFSD
jgi:flap endonuclease-1